jgi:hypothetical protein
MFQVAEIVARLKTLDLELDAQSPDNADRTTS